MKLSSIAMAAAVTLTTVSTYAAQYRIVTLPLDNLASNHFGQTLTNDGVAYSTLQREFNPLIDLSLLDFESTELTSNLTDIEAARAGNFNAADLSFVFNLLQDDANLDRQEIALFRTFKTDGIDIELVPGLDVVTDTFNDFTRSVDSIARDALSGEIAVGVSDGLYYKLPYTRENGDDITFVISDILSRGFAQVNGSTIDLPPVETALGGISEAFDINNNMQVAGYGTTAVTDTVRDAIASCADDDARADVPEEVCLANLRGDESGQGNVLRTRAQTRAHVWQLANDGSVISVETYGLVFEPEPDNTISFVSRAFGINDAGLAVGESMTGDGVNITLPGQSFASAQAEFVAVSFQNGEVTELLPREENQLSTALFANDEYIVGTVARDFNGVSRRKMFVYTIATGETRYPIGFFNSSGMVPRAINANNIIVGAADVEATDGQVRERNAFMYDIDADEFTNLNRLIECDSEYTLIEGTSINDQNDMLVNARVRTNGRNIKGEAVNDSAGEPVIVDAAYAVKLEGIAGGQIDDCQNDSEEFERSGAASSWLLLGLLGVMGWRRMAKHSG
ncbi:DUF3466 family protein [Alteromonas oceanisediminis]|uniref:DUF3466 family protein n=1 Tax=Alteromonas oceanisediminis TaxID=2836180 RepID=UPI001BDA6D57|nr:DUF3466 family protein [Alteromonas oceanisediminis]MBT0587110.1 DUF3466 family protein [Alteromonas oceanisediminis]